MMKNKIDTNLRVSIDRRIAGVRHANDRREIDSDACYKYWRSFASQNIRESRRVSSCQYRLLLSGNLALPFIFISKLIFVAIEGNYSVPSRHNSINYLKSENRFIIRAGRFFAYICLYQQAKIRAFALEETET
jgi:hypothetical protein